MKYSDTYIYTKEYKRLFYTYTGKAQTGQPKLFSQTVEAAVITPPNLYRNCEENTFATMQRIQITSDITESLSKYF